MWHFASVLNQLSNAEIAGPAKTWIIIKFLSQAIPKPTNKQRGEGLKITSLCPSLKAFSHCGDIMYL